MIEQDDIRKLHNSMDSIQAEIQRLKAPYEDALSNRIFNGTKKKLFIYFGVWGTIITAILAFFGFNAYDKIVSGATQLAVQHFSKQVQPDLLKKVDESIQADLENLSKSIKKKYDIFDKNLTGVSEGRVTLNTRVIETLEQVKQITQRVEILAQAVDSLSKGRSVSIETSTDFTRNISKTLDKAKLSKYTIYIHFYDEKDKASVSRIADKLRDLGYSVPALRQVDAKVNDIRYYHMLDEEAAFHLENDVLSFLKDQNMKRVKLGPEYFGDQYQNVRQGVIELWLNFT
jgi:hypothetical protein